MSTLNTVLPPPSSSSTAPAVSTTMPTIKPSATPLDPRTRGWIQRLVKGMRTLATSEVERRRIAKKLF